MVTNRHEPVRTRMTLRDLSIKRKLTLLAMLTSGIAVVLSSASFLTYDLMTFRDMLSRDLSTEAKMVAYNSAAALAFNDEKAASTLLSSLSAKPGVVKAVLYDADGRVFAHFSRPGAPPMPALPVVTQRPEYRFTGSHMEVFRDVSVGSEPVGTLFLQSDMEQWNTRARQYALTLAIFVLLAGLSAWLVAARLQVLISRPILELEQTMRAVTAGKNYEIRAVGTSRDETGRLIEGFNTMLAEIQHRDKALQQANGDLQSRTQELEDQITHRKRTQEELLKAKDAAEDASRAKSAFLANMSHELRTPLNAIIGYSEILEEETRASGPEQNLYDLQRIKAAGKHLLALINDVLDLSKIEAGKMSLHLETCALAPLIDEIITTLEPAAQQNGNRLVVTLPDDVGDMNVDVTKLRQILFNLLSNACKFTEQGTVTLDVARQRLATGERLVFRVGDTGIGMTPDQQRHLFQYFSQAESSTSRKYGGTGLGLAISLRFTRMMGGNITAVSEAGTGSVFTLELPSEVPFEAPEPLPSAAAPEAVPAPVAEGRATVLVIDDDPDVRDLMTRYFDRSGYEVLCAADGCEGLQLARQHRPAIISLDIVMPYMNGWEVLTQLKSSPDLSDIPVIVLTMVDGEAMGVAGGASGVLRKPIDRNRLTALIHKYRPSPGPALVSDRFEPAGV
jgi:signal transduction histidine kinase/ActR/RegA family two-component response regulator